MEVDKRGKIRLPWFYVCRIHTYLFLIIGIFVSQSCKGMAEFMNDNRLEISMMRHGEIVGVQDAATTVLLCIHEYDNVLIRSSGQPVVEIFQMERRQIPVAVERIEMRMQSRILPDAFRGL